jgi:hypothetical protein
MRGGIRPLVRHACGTLTELNRLHACGRISRGRLHTETLDVLAAVSAGLPPGSAYSPASPAGAAPREPDAAKLVAAERVGLFPYSDASDRDSVKGQGA